MQSALQSCHEESLFFKSVRVTDHGLVSPEERRFLFKLDAILLTFASLGMYKMMILLSSPLMCLPRILHQISGSGQHQ